MSNLTYDEVVAIARERHGDNEVYEGDSDFVFALLVGVADCYVSLLELEAGDDPAPGLGNTTPMQMALFGLAENLDMKRGGEPGLPQFRGSYDLPI